MFSKRQIFLVKCSCSCFRKYFYASNAIFVIYSCIYDFCKCFGDVLKQSCYVIDVKTLLLFKGPDEFRYFWFTLQYLLSTTLRKALLKTFPEKEKILVTSICSCCQNVFQLFRNRSYHLNHVWVLLYPCSDYTLTHYQTTNFRLFQTERVYRQQFQI